MRKEDIEAILQAAFQECQVAGFPLELMQQQILLQVAETLSQQNLDTHESTATSAFVAGMNPLDDLSDLERDLLLDYIRECEASGLDWKTQILNDWLQGQDSGTVQFIRDRQGLQWLEQVQPTHLAAYGTRAVRVKVGDRLEVSNTLWEWIPETHSQEREWYACTVIRVFETSDGDSAYFNCTVRLENGLEYDIHGMYDWNHYNWRWPGQS